ncbi:TfoX/Sxy family protein [Hoeflea sp. G2-23]|uniref:TfoX/Sxy family protein n=1 Tax=Hoeflea algicola TaxID=2983763 RepID=A0ABT3Z6A5_9HYPH|nr:TfoX/Sxy family protein [Hoeflea algicola]MCY0147272.1 TfoX/Sxy family protein [Hoeflea algicola]
MTGNLAPRIRALLADTPGIGEIRMFGGICFTLNGNMMCADSHTGQMLVRLSRAEHQAALCESGTMPMVMRGKPMAGYLYVTPAELESEPALSHWLERALAHARTLPPKPGKSKPKQSSR